MDDAEAARPPLTTAGPVSGSACGADGACTPLTTAVLPADARSKGKRAWLPLTTAVLMSVGVVRPDAWGS